MHPFQLQTSSGLVLTLRSATAGDIEALVALNRLSYPTLAEDNVVWSAEHLHSHIELFPEGQLVAETDDQIVGAISTLIVDMGRDPLRPHTYQGITDGGWFNNHDPTGDTLYGADVYVHPDYRRQGIASTLYEARRRLCANLNLRRILLGGRLYDYGRFAKKIAPEEYARRVEAGELKDTVLSFQLSQGFTLEKVLPNYLKDRRSRDNASLLQWLNPEWVPQADKADKVRVTCVQYEMRAITSFEEFANQVSYFVDVAAGYRADFVLFPELLTAQLMSFIDVKTPVEAIRQLTTYTDDLDELFVGLARDHDIHIIGGSHPIADGDRILNVATLYTPTGRKWRQSKIHVTPNEKRWWGVTGGDVVRVFDTPKARIGIAICYDVEFPEMVRAMVDQGAEIVFVPFCTDDRQAYYRVRYCAHARAIENQVYVAMAGTVGNLPQTENMDIQYARSAVLTPSDYAFARDGIRVEAEPCVEQVITCDLDLLALRRAVHQGSVKPRLDRRPDLFEFALKTIRT